MEFEILDALEDLRYEEKVDEQDLSNLLKDTARYSKLLAWICAEIKSSSNLEESVTRVETNEDLKAFHMELSSLLRELGCPYDVVMTGDMNARFDSPERRLLILNFLLGELQAARIAHVNNPKQLKVELAESNTARLLRQLMQTIKISKPPANVPMSALLGKINERLNEIQKKMSPKLRDKPIFVGELSDKQWSQLEQLNRQFQEEYHMRREMLLKRLDVTIQSFHWADRLQSKKDEINELFRKNRTEMKPAPKVSLSDILAARTDLAIMEKTSCASVRKNTRSRVNTIVIGRVPDRGGRPNEVQPPPPEMPPWQQRQGGSQGGQGGWNQGGQHNQGRGGQGGWNQGPQTQTNYGQGRGAQGQGRGGWNQNQQSHTNYGQGRGAQGYGGGAQGGGGWDDRFRTGCHMDDPQGHGGWSQGPQTQRDYGPGRGPRGGGHQRPKVQGNWSR